jgi:hypothetical protein
MKIFSQVLVLALSAASSTTTTLAFQSPVSSPSSSSSSSSSKLYSTLPETSFDPALFPLDTPLENIMGGKTVRTYPLPPGQERIQLVFKTNGRPLKCKVGLWLGPLRQTHNCEIDIEDGQKTPFRYNLKFKPVGQVLRIETSDMHELPVLAGVLIPNKERQNELKKNTETVWKMADKTLIQGGSVEGGGGAIRTWEIPENVDSIQFLSWAKDTGMKSFKMKVELSQGPNNPKQDFLLQCGGGSQPWHGIFETPGNGWQLRITNKKFMEDGLYQCAVLPFEVRD